MTEGKVRRGRKYNKGYWEGYSWICVQCGREWSRRYIAQGCEDRGHSNQVMFYQHDEIEEPMNLGDYCGSEDDIE